MTHQMLTDSLTAPSVIDVVSVHRSVAAELILHSDSVGSSGVYPALVSATIGIDIRDQVIRVVSDDFVGLIGIYYGKTITGATVRGPGIDLTGAAALQRLVTINNGVYDILALKREIVARKLKQSLGIDLAELITIFDAKANSSLEEIIEQQICLNSAVSALCSSQGDQEANRRLLVDFPEGWGESPIGSFPKPPRPNLDEVFFFGPSEDNSKKELSELSWNAEGLSEFDSASLDAIPTPATTVVAVQNQKLVVLCDLEATLTRARMGACDRADSLGTVGRMSGEFKVPQELRKEIGRTTGSFAEAMGATGRDTHQGLTGKFKESTEIYIGDVNRKSSVDRRKFIDTGKHQAVSFEISRKARKNVAAIAVAICVVVCFGVGFNLILNANESLSSAEKKLNTGDLVGARDLYNKLLVKDPNNFAAYAGRGAAVAIQAPNDAVKDYQKALTLNPGATAVREKFADLLLHQGKVAEAMAQAKIILAGEPENGNANRVAGMCLVKLGSYKESIEPLRTGLTSKSGNRSELCYYLFKALSHSKQNESAALYIDEAVQLEPANVRYLIDRARFRIASANYQNAAKDLKQARKLAPLNPEPCYLLGICAYEQSNLRHAISFWTEALNRGFDHPDLYKHRGHALFESGAFAESLQDLDRYLAVKPEDKVAYKRRTLAMDYVKRSNPTIKFVESKPVKAKPVVYYGADSLDSGYQALQAGDHHSAVSLLTKAVQSNPDNATARKYLAYAHLNAGSMDKAVSQFQAWNYLQAIPPSEMWVFGKTLMKAGKYAQASQVFDDLVKSDPTNVQARLQLIKALSLTGQTERARAVCLKSMSEAKDKGAYESYRALMP